MVAAVTFGCDQSGIIRPPTVPQDLIGQTRPLTQSQQSLIDGVYAVDEGSGMFGDSVAIRRSGNKITVYTGKKSGHMIFQVGNLDSVIMFVGYWKYQNSNETGLVQAYMKREEGGSYIMSTGTEPAPAQRLIRLFLGEGTNLPSEALKLRYVRPFSQKAIDDVNNFILIGHRCGGRMSDGIPHSENTIEMAMASEELGCNGIEVDIRKSKDGVLYLYHDNTINPRLVRKNTLVGATEDYTWPVLSSEVTLIWGEKMPTLEAFLDAVITKTEVVFVYLDTKTVGDGIIADMIPIQQAALAKAQSLGRNIKIYIGIPNADLLDELKQIPNYKDQQTLIETSPDDCIDVNGKVWSPRWSDGTQNENITRLKGLGKTCICWTVDVPQYIDNYLFQPEPGRFNGFLSNYAMYAKFKLLMQ
ncbi:MAG: glycerophosphodiester phosphodiesterase family protein [Candidatus Kapabacteria bacterium]|nr:glycerophosphodiester phosphodiesterase family protein [Candidatus Kapabacteria bacterium]